MKNIILLSICVTALSLVFLYGCKTKKGASNSGKTNNNNTPGNMTETPPKWAYLISGAVGNRETEAQFMIKSEDEWTKVWKETNQSFEPMPPKPAVDFTKNWVIACMMGMKRSGGHSLKIKDLTVNGDALKISIENTSPGKNCMSVDMITYPYAFYTIEHFKQSKVTFESTAVSKDCN